MFESSNQFNVFDKSDRHLLTVRRWVNCLILQWGQGMATSVP